MNLKRMLFAITIVVFLLMLIVDLIISKYGIIGYFIVGAILILMVWGSMDIYDMLLEERRQ